MKTFIVRPEDVGRGEGEKFKCGGCLWTTTRLFVFAGSKEEAVELVRRGEGLCGECYAEVEAEVDARLEAAEAEGGGGAKVVVSFVREGGLGSVRVYEVDREAFERRLSELSPSCDEDWGDLAEWVKENGRLLYEVSPDYTITVEEG